MIEKYYLNCDELPTLPTPHDCPIVEIKCVNDFLIFQFAKDLSLYDSIRFKYPKVKSLTIKFHLTEPEVYSYIWKRRLFGRGYELVDNKKIIRKHNNLDYLYQYISYESLIIKMYKNRDIFIEFSCDYVEYEWI